jgi:hypothetical protein
VGDEDVDGNVDRDVPGREAILGEAWSSGCSMRSDTIALSVGVDEDSEHEWFPCCASIVWKALLASLRMQQ